MNWGKGGGFFSGGGKGGQGRPPGGHDPRPPRGAFSCPAKPGHGRGAPTHVRTDGPARLPVMTASDSASKVRPGFHGPASACATWARGPGGLAARPERRHSRSPGRGFRAGRDRLGARRRPPPPPRAALAEAEISLREPARREGRDGRPATYELRFGDPDPATLRLDAPPAALFSVERVRPWPGDRHRSGVVGGASRPGHRRAGRARRRHSGHRRRAGSGSGSCS